MMGASAANSVVGSGQASRLLSDSEIDTILADGLREAEIDGQRVLFIIPDGTRTAPLPMLFKKLCGLSLPRANKVDFLIALGTHLPMPDEAINKLVGISAEQRRGEYARVNIFNHEWQKPETFATIGHISECEIEKLSEGVFKHAVDVTTNKMLLDYDRVIICGPVFPHEVAGFSGGNKYFFPGVSGPQMIHLTHWIGALLTSYKVIGTKHTPIRAVFDRAASFIPTRKYCLAFVAKDGGLAGLYGGLPEDAWSAAADLSAQIHIRRVPKPFKQVISVMPEMYEDFWTAAKGMYKMEPVVAEGGELIIYAPHIKELSFVHGAVLDEIGYHVRDYFVKQWDKFKHHPWGVIAHSTHTRGNGEYENGVEKSRIRVTLATQIPRERCEKICLNYRDPGTMNLEDFAHREADGVLLVRKAGELLYRLEE